jgi:hypothetical protein
VEYKIEICSGDDLTEHITGLKETIRVLLRNE